MNGREVSLASLRLVVCLIKFPVSDVENGAKGPYSG